MADTRIERDSMGEMVVPANTYYGVQTARAVENFPISGLRFPRSFIAALGTIKRACARVNAALGLLDPRLADAIGRAAAEVAEGKLDGEFVVDVLQTGSGTSTNMNANEVIANRALELLGGRRGDKAVVHPNDHVNMSQSTNDVFPTAIHVAAYGEITRVLLPALEELAAAFEERARAFADVVKAGRTHLQDAVPMTLGQEFGGYASVVRHGIARLRAALPHLAELPIGGTALGTSGALRTLAVGLMKIANDLRLLASGSRTGLNEIELPATQPRSSIMPGKVNPVIPEAVNQVAALVIGHDATIAVAGMNGNLDLNVMMPVIAHALLEQIAVTAASARVFARRCVRGITANVERCRQYAELTGQLVTAIAPVVGYDRAADLFKKAMARDVPIRQVLEDEKVLPKEEIARLLDLHQLARGGRAGGRDEGRARARRAGARHERLLRLARQPRGAARRAAAARDQARGRGAREDPP